MNNHPTSGANKEAVSWLRRESQARGWEQALDLGLESWRALSDSDRVATLAAVTGDLLETFAGVRQDLELQRNRLYRTLIDAFTEVPAALQPRHWRQVMVLATRLGHYKEALDAGAQLTRYFPDQASDPKQREIMGCTYFRLGQYARARDYLGDLEDDQLSRPAQGIRRQLALSGKLEKAHETMSGAFDAARSGDRSRARDLIGEAVALVHDAPRAERVMLPRTLQALAGVGTAPPPMSEAAPAKEDRPPIAQVLPVFCAGFRWSGASAVRDFLLEQQDVAAFWHPPRFMHEEHSSYDTLLGPGAGGGDAFARILWRFVAEQILGLTIDANRKNPLQIHNRSILAQVPKAADLSAMDMALARMIAHAAASPDGAAPDGRYIAALIQSLCRLCSPTARYMLFDSVIRAWGPDLLAAVPGARMIVVLRDPRDMYATHVDRGRWGRGVDAYIKELAGLLERFTANRDAAEGAGDLHVVKFEDFVGDAGVRAGLLDWLGMSTAGASRQGRHFNPEQSAQNVGVHRSFTDQAAIRKIEAAFPDLCRPLPSHLASLPVRTLSFSVMASKSQQQDRMGLAGLPGEPGWKVRRHITMDLLVEGRYDFVGLQHCHTDRDEEYDAVGFFQTRLAERGLDYGVINRGGKRNSQNGDSTPLFYRRDRWQPDPDDHGFTWFDVPEPADQPGSGGLLFVHGVFHERNDDGDPTGRRIFVCNTRLRDKHTDVLDVYRLHCLSVLFAAVQKRLDAGLPVIVLGDTNCKAVDSLSDRYMRGQDVMVGHGERCHAHPAIRDALLTLHPELHGNIRTQHNFAHPGRIRGHERNTRIFYGGGMAARSAGLLTFNRDGNYPSYHYPLEAEFDLPTLGKDRTRAPGAKPALKQS